MGNITLSIPDDILRRMKKHKEIKWSEVARQKIIDYLNALELLDELSDLSEEEAIKLGLEIHHQEKNVVWEKWKKEHLNKKLQ
jgi:predicted CopG family antitoxin